MKKRHLLIWAMLAGLLVAGGCRGKSGAEAALELITKLGGSFKTDDRFPDKPVVTVDLRDTAIADDQLQCLKELPQLKVLVLDGTKVSDSGIESLKECSQLQRLFLRMTRVTPAGIEDLRRAFPKAEIAN